MIMTWSYGCLVAALAAVLLLCFRPLWRRRGLLLSIVLLAAGLELVACVSLLAESLNLASVVVAFFGLHVLFNLARVAAGRLPADYLYHSVVLANSWLAVFQIAAGFAVVLGWRGWLPADRWTVLLALLQLAVAIGVAISTRRQLKKTWPDGDIPEISDGKLPTVTVAIPVRDEGGQLEACLTSALSSNYSKLEILAFDDDSQDRTPDIIRSFAHAGVRFLRTEEPKNGWLDKNRAYAELAANANGEYILFCGADVRLGVRSLRKLVALAESRQKTMVSVMPQNKLVGHVPLLQAMRYYWEMAPPRRLFRRPPVLSSCWLIKRSVLLKAGGFSAVKQSMSPEAHMAYYAASHDDGYSFVRSNDELQITSEKPVSDQKATALYRRYLQLHRRPEFVAFVVLGQALLLLGPAVMVAAALIMKLIPDYVAVVAGLAFVIHCLAFGAIQKAAFPNASLLIASLAMPASISTDIAYMYRSMYRYEFQDVVHKRRNLSQHVMRNPQ